MVQWRSDNFEWKKIRFSLKSQRSYVVPKNAHNTRRTLLCSAVARSACDFAWPAIVAHYCRSAVVHRYCLHSSSTLKKNGSARGPTRMRSGLSWKPTRILYAGQANPTHIFAGLCGASRPLCHSTCKLWCHRFWILILKNMF